MPTITFRSKIQEPKYVDGTSAGRYVKVPEIKSSHCDMDAFRSDRAFSDYANSDLFPSIIRRALALAGVGDRLDMSNLPSCVQVDESGFLAQVTIVVNKWR